MSEQPDHRKLGRALDLFSLDEDVGAGLVLWHPKGALVRKLMEDWWRDAHLARGYDFVISPHVGKGALWERSGHLDCYRDSMFPGLASEHGELFMKPMNCPFHMQIFRARPRSHRELPLRFAELGVVYRYERSGALHGLLRSRGFCQDDAHLFCAEDQAEQEVAGVLAFALELLKAFGFDDVEVALSSRPAKFVGDPARWDAAEHSLRNAAARLSVPLRLDEGGGAFYGPKLDVHVRDAMGRQWQCSSIQFDFNLPERFDLSYIGRDGRPHRPLVLHRALFGSLERFFAVLLEHFAGALPPWLAPEQVRLLAVDAASEPWAQAAVARLKSRGVRARVEGGERLGALIRAAEQDRVPFIGVVGAREAERQSLNLRGRGELPLDDVLALLERELARPPVSPPENCGGISRCYA